MSSSAFARSLRRSDEGRVPSASARDVDPRRSSPAPSVRAQAAIVRALADALEHHIASGDAADSLRDQLVEELARLGLRPSRKVSGAG
jgi:hypothetical protein